MIGFGDEHRSSGNGVPYLKNQDAPVHAMIEIEILRTSKTLKESSAIDVVRDFFENLSRNVVRNGLPKVDGFSRILEDGPYVQLGIKYEPTRDNSTATLERVFREASEKLSDVTRLNETELGGARDLCKALGDVARRNYMRPVKRYAV